MQREEHIDYHFVADEHLAVHERLNQWARWVKVRPSGWQVAPMFRQYRTKRQYDAPFASPAPVNVPEAMEMEQAVSRLPSGQRDAVRWAYVFPSLGPVHMARRLEITKEQLAGLLLAGRESLNNSLTNGH